MLVGVVHSIDLGPHLFEHLCHLLRALADADFDAFLDGLPFLDSVDPSLDSGKLREVDLNHVGRSDPAEIGDVCDRVLVRDEPVCLRAG